MNKMREKVLEDLIEKLHLLPESMGEVKEKEEKDPKAAAIAVLMGDKKDEDEEEDEE